MARDCPGDPGDGAAAIVLGVGDFGAVGEAPGDGEGDGAGAGDVKVEGSGSEVAVVAGDAS